MSQASLFNLMPERRVWKVSELTDRIRDLLESAFFDIWVEGEVSNFRAAQSGHLYFTLKDAHAQIRCICFRDQARGLKTACTSRCAARSASTMFAASIRFTSRISSPLASALCSSHSNS